MEYKYESKWREGVYLPLLHSDSLSELKKFKYNIIEITKEEWRELKQ